MVRIVLPWYDGKLYFFSSFFPKQNSNQLSLGQFLFEINRPSIRREILRKLCASHHVFSITQRQKFTG